MKKYTPMDALEWYEYDDFQPLTANQTRYILPLFYTVFISIIIGVIL
jgi:hypothetical protein